MNTFKKITDYFKDVQLEMKKVVWPKKQEVIRLTLVVFLISGVVAAYVGALDFVMTKSLTLLFAR